MQGKESQDKTQFMGITHNVLDHGFIRVVDVMGNDSSIVQAARVSYGDGTKTKREDSGLINYLMKHRHTSPFEMCEIKLHIKLPMFIARQWIRHRTANVNECSARYSILPEEYYIPEIENIAPQSSKNKQCRGGEISNDERVKDYSDQHPNEREDDLSVREGGDIAIAHGCDRLGCPVQCPYVHHAWLTSLDPDPGDPSVITEVVKFGS